MLVVYHSFCIMSVRQSVLYYTICFTKLYSMFQRILHVRRAFSFFFFFFLFQCFVNRFCFYGFVAKLNENGTYVFYTSKLPFNSKYYPFYTEILPKSDCRVYLYRRMFKYDFLERAAVYTYIQLNKILFDQNVN